MRIRNSLVAPILAALSLVLLQGTASAKLSRELNRAPLEPTPKSANITGFWRGDDGATYCVRQIGNTVWWYGLGKTYGHVFRGAYKTVNSFSGEWADVPSHNTQGYGTLTLTVVNHDKFIRVGGANFQTKEWIRSDTIPTASAHALYQSMRTSVNSIEMASVAHDFNDDDLTGVWHAVEDGATYYIRQIGDQVWWFGEGSDFGNVFRGHRSQHKGEYPIITGEWADVPFTNEKVKAYGMLSLTLIKGHLEKTNYGGSLFTAKVFNRVSAGIPVGNAGGNSGISAGGNLIGGGVIIMEGIDWLQSPDYYSKNPAYPNGLRGQPGRFQFTCPPAPSNYGEMAGYGHVFGSGPYSDNSSICLAAVHAGVIKNPAAGGKIKIKMGAGMKDNPGSTKHGVKSMLDPGSSGTFTFVP